jgi:hypothetical protein
MSARRSLAVLLVVMLVAASASAIPIFGDPDTAYLLEIVGGILKAIADVELTLQLATHHRIDLIVSHFAFPDAPGPDGSIFLPIRQAIREVRGIRREIEALSCSWVFSPRTALLRGMLLHPLRICRSGFQLVWGSSERHWDADAQELQDYVGTLTANTVSARVDSERSWTKVFPDMEAASALLRRSPGEANRDEAVLLAAAGQVASSNSLLASQKLLVKGLDREMERRDERLAATAEMGLLVDITCLDEATCARRFQP